MPKRPVIGDPRLALLVGLAAYAFGSWCLYDAFEGRGKRTPMVLRPITWW